MADIDRDLFNSQAHRTAQTNCLIACAVGGPTRKAAVEQLDDARKIGDVAAFPVLIARLTGPCCLPPARKEQAGCPNRKRQPVDVTITVKPLDGGDDTTPTYTPDTIQLTPTRGADRLHDVTVEITPDRVTVAVIATDPHTRSTS
jgi:hypothetical protein